MKAACEGKIFIKYLDQLGNTWKERKSVMWEFMVVFRENEISENTKAIVLRGTVIT